MSNNQVCCAFCNEEYSPSEIGGHLLYCANKTEQCPNCEKFVRRAVFAYHYENNCAPDPETATSENETRETAPHRPMITVKCQYCLQNCYKADYRAHKKNCVKNPESKKSKQKSFADDDSSHDTDFRRQSNASNEDLGVPCEWCFESIPFDHYQRHAEACQKKEHRKLLERHRERDAEYRPAVSASSTTSKPLRAVSSETSSVNVARPSATDTAECMYCNRTVSANGLSYHQLVCVKNAKRNKN